VRDAQSGPSCANYRLSFPKQSFLDALERDPSPIGVGFAVTSSGGSATVSNGALGSWFMWTSDVEFPKWSGVFNGPGVHEHEWSAQCPDLASLGPDPS
jgi:hypothetical protein